MSTKRTYDDLVASLRHYQWKVRDLKAKNEDLRKINEEKTQEIERLKKEIHENDQSKQIEEPESPILSPQKSQKQDKKARKLPTKHQTKKEKKTARKLPTKHKIHPPTCGALCTKISARMASAHIDFNKYVSSQIKLIYKNLRFLRHQPQILLHVFNLLRLHVIQRQNLPPVRHAKQLFVLIYCHLYAISISIRPKVKKVARSMLNLTAEHRHDNDMVIGVADALLARVAHRGVQVGRAVVSEALL